MPTYCFDLDEDGGLTRDDSGSVLDNDRAAKAVAIRVLSEIVGDTSPDGRSKAVSVAVRCGDGSVFFRASLTLQCDQLT